MRGEAEVRTSVGGAPVLEASVSEYTHPWPGKTLAPKRYGCCAWRLETNAQLYEGLRFGWLFYRGAAPWTLTSVTSVAQARPANYTASFASADAALARAWHVGAYAARLNMLPHTYSSILMDRGDRVALQGDSHPTLAAALASVRAPPGSQNHPPS